MLHPYIINSINAAILIVAGFIVYFIHPDRPQVALVAPGLGLMLMACTYHLRKHNRFVTHTVTALTLLAAIVVIMRLNAADETLDMVHVLLFAMAISCLVAVGVFIGTFIRERRLRNNTIYKDDL
ncbi:hypothetical protein H8S95_04010 [Pontibacter sp. KCTC 32443]|uniref:hypothetical protein n=1 Tax=Pontibacter TaxID=323449 RepID=UPI00164D589B|nr:MULTISPECIES: hypothetical protein [Pontibacter]MBC5773218.1 hypothetical protein [Pontibacter sp. KCTC 32443]